MVTQVGKQHAPEKTYAWVAGVASMYSELHGLLCLSLYVVLYAWSGRVRYSEVHFVPVVRCVGCMPTR